MNRCRHEEHYEDEDIRSDLKISNRIFLNFTREFTHPERDKPNVLKVQDLFKSLAEKPQMQEIKVSGWLGKI